MIAKVRDIEVGTVVRDEHGINVPFTSLMNFKTVNVWPSAVRKEFFETTISTSTYYYHKSWLDFNPRNEKPLSIDENGNIS